MPAMHAVSARRLPGGSGGGGLVGVRAAGGVGCSTKGLGGMGATCALPSDCPSGKVCAGGFCADPGNGRIGSPCSATRDCSGGNFCDGVPGVCTMGGGVASGGSCSSD